MSGIFDKYYKKYDNWYEKNEYAYLSEIKALKKGVPKKGKGVEIGVGTGRFAHKLGAKFGIDPSKNMLRIARRRGVGVKRGFGENLPYDDSFFDYALFIITICFIKNPERALREARRVLKKNGRIVIGIIDKKSFLGKFYQRKKSVFYKKAIFFSAKEITKMLEGLGFSKFQYWQTMFELPEKLKQVDKIERGFGKGGFVVITAVK